LLQSGQWTFYAFTLQQISENTSLMTCCPLIVISFFTCILLRNLPFCVTFSLPSCSPNIVTLASFRILLVLHISISSFPPFFSELSAELKKTFNFYSNRIRRVISILSTNSVMCFAFTNVWLQTLLQHYHTVICIWVNFD